MTSFQSLTIPIFLLTLVTNAPRVCAQGPAPSPEDRALSAPLGQLDFRILQGNWIRPDGGYVVAIKGIDETGKIDAMYFNPYQASQLPFARANATLSGPTLSVFLELRAGGYGGSTYTLTYEPSRDQLVGVYFQAVAQQQFNISFIRAK